MTIFEELENLHSDYLLIANQIKIHSNNVKEIKDAISSRIESEQKQTAKRIEELENKCNGANETVRSIAKIELERLKEYTPNALPEEIQACKDEISAFETALNDLRKLRKSIETAIGEANDRIKEINAATIGDSCYMVYDNWLSGCRSTLANLCKEV